MKQATVTERPINFTQEMVKAILEGRKTQTRRIVDDCKVINDPRTIVGLTDGNAFAHFRFEGDLTDFAGRVSKYGNIGDRLWVRETYAIESDPIQGSYTFTDDSDAKHPPYYLDVNKTKRWIYFKVDLPYSKLKWRASTQMPRCASRILLEITDIRVERLHDITEEDAIAEGVQKITNMLYRNYSHKNSFARNAITSFVTLWMSLFGEDAAKENSWVWVYDFKVLEIKDNKTQSDLMEISKLFEEMVSTGQKVYRSKNKDIIRYLKDRIRKIRLDNKGIMPDITNHKWKCLTCGRKDKGHPETGFCFVCDTDNWESISNK